MFVSNLNVQVSVSMLECQIFDIGTYLKRRGYVTITYGYDCVWQILEA